MKNEESFCLEYLYMIFALIFSIIFVFGLIAMFGGVVIPGTTSIFVIKYAPDYKAQLDQLNQEMHRTMPDEITVESGEECIENKTVEYFAGFDKTKQIGIFTMEELETLIVSDYPDINPIEGNCMLISVDLRHWRLECKEQEGIQNRTYCTKVHVIRTK